MEHDASCGVNVLNLVEGEEAIVESPTGAFEPFHVHYAETFIVPANVGRYTSAPSRRKSEPVRHSAGIGAGRNHEIRSRYRYRSRP